MTTMAQYSDLAKLLPGMPASELERILGDEWGLPGVAEKGYFTLHGPMLETGHSFPFTVRITTAGTIGAISFYGQFPRGVPIHGLSIGLPLEAVRKIHPVLLDKSAESSPKFGIEAYLAATSEGEALTIMIKEGVVLALHFERLGSQYPGELPPKIYPKRDGIRAYDLDILHQEVDRTTPDNHGWVFGLPPGITPEQWPLDPISGYPLMHGFTLKLPEDYRVHGPEIVALSFFATASDQNDGGALKRDDFYSTVTDADAPPPDDHLLLPFWRQAKAQHPKLHRMRDILGYEYAVILLTEVEFGGPLCFPPVLTANPFLDESKRPRWLNEGSGHSCFRAEGGFGLDGKPFVEGYVYRALGAVPQRVLEWNRAIICTPRVRDENAGLAPKDTCGQGPADTGYVGFYFYEGTETTAEYYREHEWAKGHKPNHIGGTMRPVQATPEFSPYYIGFEEYFGGYNFGAGGNAQLDFLEMKFDWSCG